MPLEQLNPYGTYTAALEDDGRTVYFYLWCPEESELQPRAVWVTNRVPAPEEPDAAAPEQGRAPLMHREGTRAPEGRPPLDPESLSVVWFEEGNGAALVANGAEGEQILAVLPPWSGEQGFMGYSFDAVGQQALAWELAGEALKALREGVDRSREYWKWRSMHGSWKEIQESRLSHLEARLGAHQGYWSADGGHFPPLGIASFQPYAGVTLYVTVGMSGQPMPRVEMAHSEPAPFRRVELALAIEDDAAWALPLLGTLIRLPWNRDTWLGDRHVAAQSPGSHGLDVPAVLLVRDPLLDPTARPAPVLSGLVDRSGDPVTYLWLVPVGSRERRIAEREGVAFLIRRLAREGRSWIAPAEVPETGDQ